MNKIKVFRYCSIFFIILFFFPLLRGYILVREYIFLFTFPLLCLFLYPKAFYNKSFLFLSIYFISIYFFYNDHEKYDFVYTISEVLSFGSVITIINVCLYNKDFKSLYIIFCSIIIILIIFAF